MEENNLKDLAIRLQAIIDTAIDGVLTIDVYGIVEQINMAAAELFQYLPEEVIGNNVKMLMPEPHHGAHDGHIERYNRTKIPKIIGIGREVKGRKKDGSTFPFRLAVSEVILNDRIIFTGIIHDLTDVKRAQEKLLHINEELEDKVEERTNELAEVINRLLDTNKKLIESEEELTSALEKEKELNQLKSRFVSLASHEFRTPLSTILSSASLISKYVDTEQQDKREKHVNRIKSAVTNLTEILNDFLSLSKLEEGKVNIKPREVDLDALIILVTEEMKGILKPGQKIIHTTSLTTLRTDERILKNILFNIISNAVKYSNKDIKCKVVKKDKAIEIQIKDQGLGIPAAEQKHLFDRFFRATNVETIQGTGIGLNIVQRYLNLLGGAITFKSEEGQGSTFFIHIPFNP